MDESMFVVLLHCPKCNEGMSVLPAGAFSEQSFACPACDADINVWELKTSSGETLAEYDPDVIRYNLERTKGFARTH